MLNTFVSTALQAQTVLNSLNEAFFEGTLDCKLMLIPPEEGSFLGKLRTTVFGSAAIFFTFINTPVGEAYIEGLTGYPPKHWATEIALSHREKIDQHVRPEQSMEEYLQEVILIELVKGILSKSNQELQSISPIETLLYDAIVARCAFYETCISNQNVSGIGFDREEKFPIERKDFPLLATRPVPPIVEDEEPEWHSSTENIYVTSPNWDRPSQLNRKWKGKDGARKGCLFVIEDDMFWHHVKYRDLKVEILDALKVQWVFRRKDKRIISRKVVRVLEYNGDHLADEMTSEEIGNFGDSLVVSEKDTDQIDLFD